VKYFVQPLLGRRDFLVPRHLSCSFWEGNILDEVTNYRCYNMTISTLISNSHSFTYNHRPETSSKNEEKKKNKIQTWKLV